MTSTERGLGTTQETPSAEQEMLNWGRLLMDGVPFVDLVAAQTRDPEQPWFDFWMGRADDYERQADAALAIDRRTTAGQLLFFASMCAQYAQFLWWNDGRQVGQRRKVELYRRAAPLLTPPADRFELTFEGTIIPGYVRVPTDRAGRGPAAILLGGLESTKEESYLFENLLLERGIATVTFDGPGQGEMWTDVALGPAFHRYTSVVLDHVLTQAWADPRRVGVLGRSLGGYYALESAAMDHRFVACVSWGGFVDMDEWEAETPLTKEGWRYVSKALDLDAARAHVRVSLDVRPVLGKLTCPTYFLHGALDEIPVSVLDVLREHATNCELTIDLEPLGEHCCHNLGPAPRYRLADWLAETLTR